MRPALDLQIGKDGLASLIFDLPDRRVNVFTRQVLTEFETLLPELASHRDIRVLVLLSGKTGNFIAGFDIEEIGGVTDAAVAEEGSRLGQRLFAAWNQLTGEPVLGELADSDLRLNILPIVLTSWADWKEQHPETLVLDR